MLGTITKGEYKNDPLPNNIYLAKLLNVKEKAAPKEHPDWFPQLSWSFEIVVDPFKKRRAWGRTPTNWIAGKKLDTWLVACGINVAQGTSIKIEDLKDIYVKIIVKNDISKDKETGETKYFPKVTDLIQLDSVDQIKIRELATGIPTTGTAPLPALGHDPISHTSTGVVIQGSTAAPVQPVNGPVTYTVPTSPVLSPTSAPSSTGAPSRTIPF